MYDAICHNDGLMGSTAVLVDGARLTVDEDRVCGRTPIVPKGAAVRPEIHNKLTQNTAK